jgi:hypothetical protein
LLANITTGCNSVLIREYVERSENFIDSDTYLSMDNKKLIKVYVNGLLVGLTLSLEKMYNELRELREDKTFSEQVSIICDAEDREIRIFCDAGRYIRPVLNMKNGSLIYNSEIHSQMKWEELIDENIIRYIDSNEVENSLIAMYPNDIEKYSDKQSFDYCEIHPSAMLGVCSVVIPYSSHNQNPRLIYQSSMFKQALGVYSLAYKNRFDTIAHVMHYPQKPLVGTRYDKMLHYDEMLSGANPIVAVMTYGGFNQEDSVIINQSSVDRGMFVHTCYKTIVFHENKKNNYSYEKIEIPPLEIQINGSDYSKLDKNGIVFKGATVFKGDIIVGKTLTKIQKEEEKSDCSLKVSIGEDGIVDDIWDGYTDTGIRMIKIKIRQVRIPEVADKFACFTDSTQVLTENGWKSCKDISVSEKVATLQDEKLVYNYPIKTFEYDYNGELYHLETLQLDTLVTPNHKLYIRKRGEKFKLVMAQDAFGMNDIFHKKDANWDVPDVGIFTLCIEKVVQMKDWLFFIGLFVTEGYKIETSWTIKIATHKDRVREKAEEVLKNMNFNYSIESGLINIDNKQLYQYLSVNFLPEYVWSVSKKEARWLLEGLLLGGDSWVFNTSSERLADDFQRLCLHCGYSTNKELYIKRIRMQVLNTSEVVVNRDIDKESWVQYTGKVYCLEVPGNIVYVRRNGKSYWCGNSRSSQKGVCGQMIRQEDMPYTKDGIVPDLIMSCLSYPSRMTIAQLLESLYGKVCSFSGKIGDGTTFSSSDINPAEKIANELESHGFHRYGEERMYSGYTGEMMEASIFIGPVFYQRLKHLVSDKIHCLTYDHEVLTRTGWKAIVDISFEDSVATLTPDGYIEYRNPLKIYNYPDYEGSMYEVYGDNIDLFVTGNHRMWVKDGDHYGFRTAEEIYKTGRGEEFDYEHTGVLNQNAFFLTDISNVHEDMFNFIHLIGLYYDCGGIENGVLFFYINDDKTYNFLKTFCKEYSFDYSYDGSLRYNSLKKFCKEYKFEHLSKGSLIFQISNPDFISLIKKFTSKNKYPDWLLNLDIPQLIVFLSALMDFPKNLRYFVPNKVQVDQLQHLCFHAGLSSHILYKNNGYVLVIDNLNNTGKNTNITRQKFTENIKIPVACLQVPNEIFYVRRNGKAVWTGNSRAAGNITALTKQPAGGRAQDGGLRIGEMERDCMISQGISVAVTESLYTTSDVYTVNICEICGNIISLPTECRVCRKSKIATVNLPYATKLLIQELTSLNVGLSIQVK